MLSLKPDLADGTVAILGPNGDPVGVAVARASRTIPGYVTLVSDTPLGYAIRVPADWAEALAALPEPTGLHVWRKMNHAEPVHCAVCGKLYAEASGPCEGYAATSATADTASS